ncbi:MAG TPA: hypothetical protein VK003_07190 [Oceanobacillus sp.]|nr:hypothetical protein [Oceanobacillus sp.]
MNKNLHPTMNRLLQVFFILVLLAIAPITVGLIIPHAIGCVGAVASVGNRTISFRALHRRLERA